MSNKNDSKQPTGYVNQSIVQKGGPNLETCIKNEFDEPTVKSRNTKEEEHTNLINSYSTQPAVFLETHRTTRCGQKGTILSQY